MNGIFIFRTYIKYKDYPDIERMLQIIGLTEHQIELHNIRYTITII